MNEQPKVSVVIVTWNNEKDISFCLKSLREQDYKNFQIVLIDNASSDNTLKIVKENFQEVTILPQKENLFLTGANNIGIEYSIAALDAEFVMVLNPDTYAAPDLISELIKPFDNKSVGATGPLVKFWRNQFEGLINSAGLFFDGFMQAYDIGFKEEDKGQYNSQKEVFGVTGACIMYRTEMLLQIGLYDNRIKMYLDEVELFIRAHKNNWKVIFVPTAVLGHNYMQSTNQNKSFFRQKQMQKAWLIIALKHYELKSKLAMLKIYLQSLFTKSAS
jgi:GT2 family glycosyltransferase